MKKFSQKSTFFTRKDSPNTPDLMFGIDIGMCYAKVAYAVLREEGGYSEVRNFQNWTKLGGREDEDLHVPTVLAYEKDHDLQNDAPRHIGHLKNYQVADKDLKKYEWFKDHFPRNLPRQDQEREWKNPQPAATSPVTATSTDTVILYRHLLTSIYVAIKSESPALLAPGLDWDDACIEFIFSVPATWNRLTETLDNITKSFIAVVREAGFGEDETKHSVIVGLTEPEAAAAFCLKNKDDERNIKDGDKVLVVDAGGGTTDICLLDTRHADTGEVTIDQLSAPVGVELGSSHIDRGFQRLAREKLKILAYEMGLSGRWDVDAMSLGMRHDPDFQQSKKNLNMTRLSSGEYFTVAVPKGEGVPEVLEGEDIVNKRLKFGWVELARIFDETVLEDRQVMVKGRPEVVPGIIKLIRRARDQLLHRGDGSDATGGSSSALADVDVILLSGGLGSSEYVKAKIHDSLSAGPEGMAAHMPQVHTLTEPQMCVCRGLLENRKFSIWRAGKCNGSYGILQREPYRPWGLRSTTSTHWKARVSGLVKNHEGNRYIEDVKWLIKKNEEKPSEPPSCRHTFSNINLSNSTDFVVEIVVSDDPRPSRFPQRENFIAKIPCDLGEPAQDPKTGKMYCHVEVIFHVARFEVKCWSQAEQRNRRLIGIYKKDYRVFKDDR